MLKATWLDPFHVLVSGLDGERLAEIPVTRPWKKDDLRYVLKHDGNTKTEGVIGIVNMISQGCFRAYTGFPQSDRACYVDENGGGGCYADLTRHAVVRKPSGFSVIHNGVHPGTEAWFKIQVPRELTVPEDIRTPIYRVDSETADGSMSLALGLVQDFAEANPSRKVTTISSAYFDVSDEQLLRAASLRNLAVGFTVSPWFDLEDLGNRERELNRFMTAGVTSVVWVATNPAWEEIEGYEERMAAVRRVLDSVRPEAIIEVPYHDRKTHEHSSLNENPWGACCDYRIDSKGRQVDLETFTVVGEDGPEPLKGQMYGRCKGCKLQCGVRYLNAENKGKFEEEAA